MALLNHVLSDTKPLLAVDVEVPGLTVPLTSNLPAEIPRAVKSSREAIAPDSLTLYLAGAERSPAMYELRETVLMTVSFAAGIHDQRILTIDHGSAICAYTLPGDKTSQLVALLSRLLKMLSSKEAVKRATEARDAMVGLMEASLGERIKDMIEISSLATAPEAQGRGYGTALVEAVTELADGQGRAVFLLTTDAYQFYEFVGFKVVGERQVGVDNPTWNGEPVTIRLMLRESHADRVQEKV